MKPHPILANLFPPAIVAGLAIWLAFAHQARLSRVAVHQVLEQQWQQMAELAARNAQWSNLLGQASLPEPLPPDELRELLRLRGQVGVLRRQQTGLDQARKENQQIHTVLAKYLETLTETKVKATADYWPQSSWTNAGLSSPETTLQTALWASSNGDLTNLLTNVTAEMQTNLADEYKGKSAEETSLRIADETAYIKSVQILSHEVLDDNTVLLTVEIETRDQFQTIPMRMKRIGGEWKLDGGP